MIEKINVLVDLCRIYVETDRANTVNDTPEDAAAKEEIMTKMLARIKAAAAAL